MPITVGIAVNSPDWERAKIGLCVCVIKQSVSLHLLSIVFGVVRCFQALAFISMFWLFSPYEWNRNSLVLPPDVDRPFGDIHEIFPSDYAAPRPIVQFTDLKMIDDPVVRVGA